MNARIQRRTPFRYCSLLVLGLALGGPTLVAHPGSGIVVDRQGNVYFIDTGAGVWKISRDGTITKLAAPAYHWLAFDENVRLASTKLPSFSSGGAVVSRDPRDPRIIVSSDFPVVCGPDGSLYYPWLSSNDRLQIFRLAPSGTTSVLSTLPARTSTGPLQWLNGIAAAADGSVYYTTDRSVMRVTPDGRLTTIVADLPLPACDPPAGIGPALGIYLRDLAVDAEGNVFAAATGCRSVVKIAPDKKVTTVLRSEAPWSPTAVAVSGGEVFVLEYLHIEADDRRAWLPRVRKVAADGSVATLAVIQR